MVIYGIKYNNKLEYATIYDLWDIPDKKHQIVSKVRNVTKDDVGSYLKLNDGSKQFVKILGVYKNRVNTSSGLYYTDETICMVNPRFPNTEYSGAKYGEESFDIVPVRENEKEAVDQIIKTGKTDCKMTKRIKIMTAEEMQEYIKAKGYTEKSVIDRTLDLAFGQTNQHTINALKAIDKVLCTEIYNDKKEESKLPSLAARFGLGNIRNSRMQIAEVVVEQTGD
jgi:hypothetical protein